MSYHLSHEIAHRTQQCNPSDISGGYLLGASRNDIERSLRSLETADLITTFLVLLLYTLKHGSGTIQVLAVSVPTEELGLSP